MSFLVKNMRKCTLVTDQTTRCYLGGAGIAEALRQGCDIVIAGRVADAAPTIGASMWWHGWDRETDLDQIAGSLVCGHLIECSSYVVGGYYSGFKSLMDGCENVGFPIAEVNADGSCIITKEANTGGEVRYMVCQIYWSKTNSWADFCWNSFFTATVRNPGTTVLWL